MSIKKWIRTKDNYDTTSFHIKILFLPFKFDMWKIIMNENDREIKRKLNGPMGGTENKN